MINKLNKVAQRQDLPAQDGFAVTPHDTNDFDDYARSLWVGATGSVVLETVLGTELTLLAVPSGTLLKIACRKVLSTGTTATDIVGLI